MTLLGNGEIRRGRRAQIGLDQNILRTQAGALAVGVLAHQDRQHLIGNGQRGIERGARLQREAHIGHDKDVRMHRPRHADGQILRQAAVDQQPAVQFDRREYAGRRHAGAHRDRQIALVEQHRLAGFQIGRHRAKRGRQQIEIGAVAERQGQLAQRLLQLLALNEALRQQDLAVLEAERQPHQKIAVVLLAPEGQIPARRRIAKRLLPVDRAHGGVDVVRRHAARVQSADDGAHAGAGDAVDGNLQVLEHLEHADVRDAARAAARQHQADPRAGGRVGRPGRGGSQATRAQRAGQAKS